MADSVLCVHIDDEGARCPKVAEVVIYPSTGHPGTAWESCIEHVGHLLDTAAGSTSWTVVEIEETDRG